MYDAIVVGCGPAGISTAIYLKRYGYNVLVVGKDGGALEKAHLIENYYGISSISGLDLIKTGIKQAQDLGVEVLKEEVLNIEKYSSFIVQTNKSSYEAKTVMLALGASRNKFNLGTSFEGKGVSYCTTCDGFFYRKKKVGILGSGQYMRHELSVLENMCGDITVFTNGEVLDFEPSQHIKVNTDKIVKLSGEDSLEKVHTTSGEVLIDGLFIALGSASGFTLAKHMGIVMDNNHIVVDDSMMTNIDGLFAGGDVVGGLLQVSKAVSDGAIAAGSISKYLKK